MPRLKATSRPSGGFRTRKEISNQNLDETYYILCVGCIPIPSIVMSFPFDVLSASKKSAHLCR